MFGCLTIGFGSWRDALFVGVLVSNIAIGTFQEVRSKRALARLAALVTPDTVVVRDGRIAEHCLGAGRRDRRAHVDRRRPGAVRWADTRVEQLTCPRGLLRGWCAWLI